MCGKGNHAPSGMTAREMKMNTMIRTAAGARTAALLPIVLVTAIAASVLFLAGHAQSATLHDAAHDMRHATGFPCH